MRLIHTKTGEAVKVGDVVGDKGATVTGWAKPSHAGSSGRIHTTHGHGEHFPSVFDCEWVEREDHKNTLKTDFYVWIQELWETAGNASQLDEDFIELLYNRKT